MIAKNLMKKPVLMIGILFMVIFFFQLRKSGFLDRSDKLIATSCRSALIMLNKRRPADWATDCSKNILSITQTIDLPKKVIKGGISSTRKILYREIANSLMFVAQNSPHDNLERIYMVRLTIDAPNLSIGAVTEGKYLVKLASMKSPQFIAEHLKTTVQTKELIK